MKNTRIIAFTNQKGGVGKSTTCFNVGTALSLCGLNVLFIDSDPQGDLSTMSGYRTLTDEDLTLYDVLHGANINDAIKDGNGFSVIVSDETLTRGEIDLVKEKRTALRDALGRLERQFDYILIDCPPSLNILTLNALTASDEVIIPVQAQYLPLKGVARLKETIEKTRSTLNPNLRIGGVIVTFYNGRRNLDQQVKESLESAFGAKVFETAISTNIKIAEAPSHGMSIFEYAPRSKGATEYKSLAKEITQNMKPQKER
jgi:chromosome partitioning protein